jgi:hypothetical protein
VPAYDPSAHLPLDDVLEDRPLWEDLLRRHYPGATTVVVDAIMFATYLDDDTAIDVAKLVRWLPTSERGKVLRIWPQLTDLLEDE